MAELNANVDLHVSTDGGTTWVPLNDMQTQDEGGEGTTTTTSVLMSSSTYSTAGTPNNTLTVGGLFDLDDPGQVAVRAAKQSGSVIKFRKLYDGVKGYSVDVTVIGERRGVPSPEGFQTTSFTFGRNAAPVAVASGPLLP